MKPADPTLAQVVAAHQEHNDRHALSMTDPREHAHVLTEAHAAIRRALAIVHGQTRGL